MRFGFLLSLVLAAPVAAQDQPDGPPAQVAPSVIPTSPAPISVPPPQDLAFTVFVTGLRARAVAEGVRPETFDRETASLVFDPRVVRSDRAQPGGTPGYASAGPIDFAPYRRQHVDQAHIVKGRALMQAVSARLNEGERATGIPGKIALSIVGHESGYGSFSGNRDLLRSFASLAFDGRRRELFTAELIATLKLIDRGFTRAELKGSWAGATGYPQFLPSVYLRVGTDGDGDGKADIWTDMADALASVAAYLKEAGWKPQVPWGVTVTVPAGLDRTALTSPLTSPRCPRVHARLSRWQSVAEWKTRGIVVTGFPAPADTEQARLIEPDGPDATAYLLTSNYGVILDYNCSNFYALAVGLLADEIAR